jgi:hypothetical protein
MAIDKALGIDRPHHLALCLAAQRGAAASRARSQREPSPAVLTRPDRLKQEYRVLEHSSHNQAKPSGFRD